MTPRPFRFGVCLLELGTREQWRARAREVQDRGYEVLQVPDHLDLPAPFPALVAAADVTSIGLGTYGLDAGTLSPAHFARDVADLQRLTFGRLELGLGTGYRPVEPAPGTPRPDSYGERLTKLEKTLTTTRELLATEAGVPVPPIMLSGADDRMIALGGREADIFSFPVRATVEPGTPPEHAFARRVQMLREAAGDRFDDIELNLFVAAVGDTVDEVDLSALRQSTGLSDKKLLRLPGVLVGSPRRIAERLEHYRETFGTTYISVLEPHLAAFAEVIKHLD
ncbi:TIGR03621 family F420-dependent LLM class oxidoreductase [Amycolatopsis rhabdoformis]|uniref:TIGR03621 family F420-dependent LLM class oxidoreductase n=1 Tax=Amycolatopsis rhabdoformis TaxID=1448059 RepID=A0ABZ1IEW8_9PSEU|nr:TIGR03621 family F420-dependent LLM class oxidoreductase [Amycolatopsis rhabdoformis]WSE33001.1 TIGR03621 family F420-dependent LLM class oxidoreductase [Amycolatopsis rhabdoformis]